MKTKLTKAVYAERSHTYHILTAIMEAALAEPIISKKFKQFIIDTQLEEFKKTVSELIKFKNTKNLERRMNNVYIVKNL